MTALFAFLATKVGRYTAAVVVLALVSGVVIAHYRAKAIQEGEDKVHVSDLEQQKKDLQSETAKSKAEVLHAEQDVAVAQKQMQQAMDLASRAQVVIDGFKRDLDAIESQRRVQTATVAQIPDTGLQLDVENKLGKRAASDLTPGFTIAELRAIDYTVTDYPNVVKENGILTATQKEMQAKLDALDARISADEHQAAALVTERDTATRQWNRTLVAYKQAYDEFPRHRSFGAKVCRVVTFGLGCRTKTFLLTDPIEFAKIQ